MNFRCYFTLAGMLLLTSLARAQQIKLSFNGDITDPVACEGVVYFCCSDGRLYAVKATDGSTVPGFPVDVGAAIGDGSFPVHRPAVYYGSLGKAIYVGTSKRGIAKIWPDGRFAWATRLEVSSTLAYTDTPAVTSDGEVIAGVNFAGGGHIVKLKESDGSVVKTSATLTELNAYSPSVVGDNIYTCVGNPPNSQGILVLNRSDLTVKAAIVGDALGWAPPYVRGDAVFLAGGGQPAPVYKLNSATLALDPKFGPALHPGRIGIGSSDWGCYAEVSASPASADLDPGGTIYASIQSNRIAQVVAFDAVTGNARTLFSRTDGALGMVVSSRNVIAYAAGNTMNLISITGGGMRTYTVAGRPDRPTYDATTDRFFTLAASDTPGVSCLMGFDSP